MTLVFHRHRCLDMFSFVLVRYMLISFVIVGQVASYWYVSLVDIVLSKLEFKMV